MTNIKDLFNENKGVFIIAVFTAVLASAIVANPTPAYAGSDPFIGEITFFAGNFAPRGWAYCDGQLLAISQNDALFSLYGTIYGGDGRTTFGLPDMRGRLLMDDGQGAGLAPQTIGAKSGSERITLNTNQLPRHTHDLTITSSRLLSSPVIGDSQFPTSNSLGLSFARIYSTQTPTIQLHENSTSVTIMDGSLTTAGVGNSHDNVPPYLNISCISSLVGVYPSRN
jgi:microcystin-dependent protein